MNVENNILNWIDLKVMGIINIHDGKIKNVFFDEIYYIQHIKYQNLLIRNVIENTVDGTLEILYLEPSELITI